MESDKSRRDAIKLFYVLNSRYLLVYIIQDGKNERDLEENYHIYFCL